MITLVVGSKAYQFKNVSESAKWIEKNPTAYGDDLANITMYSDEPIEDVIEAIVEVKHDFYCRGCAAHLMFTRHPSEHHFRVICKVCSTVHHIEAHGDAGSSES